MLQAILKLLWLSFLLTQHHIVHGKQIPFLYQPRLRNATLNDADAIVDIFTAAFDPMPDWQYLFPFRHDYPRDHKRCYRSTVMLYLTHPAAHTEVIESSSGSGRRLVAAAVWVQNSSEAHSDALRRPSECMHRDMNITRAVDYEHKFNAARRKYVDNVFGADQLYLHELGTHPDYQARGAGTQLVVSGLKRGDTAGVNVSLVAQPTAETFYLHRGFQEVNNISIESVDGDQAFRYNVMAYNFSRK